jgi:hypothetical protein
MPCCGQKREQIRTLRAVPSRPSSGSVTPPGPGHQPRVLVFEYVGKTALTAVGPVSGGHYRFNRPGALVEVDPRDGPALAAIPNLRQKPS